MTPSRGEVWLFDCGMVEKTRPVVILSKPFEDTDRAVVTVVFHAVRRLGLLTRSQMTTVQNEVFRWLGAEPSPR
jgi:mRNA-degrading endonuclease toxin of MazEF toxin-antitoxin module